VIRDARVLQDDFIPKEVAHRDPEVNRISDALAPITDGDSGETTFLFGPSGVGKTCLAQFVTERLREQILDLETCYVNCWEDYNRYRTLYRVLDGVTTTHDIHRQSTPQDVLLERLRGLDEAPYVVILDEVDQLQDTRALYDLYSIPQITMVLIANREEALFAGFDDRLRSRLRSSVRVRFDAYGSDALVAILRDRVRWGLSDDSIGPGVLERAADAAAGDARVAIGTLRRAAREATTAGHDRITTDLVTDAVPEAKAAIHQKNVAQLTPDQRVLYEVVTEYDEIAPGELYDEYARRVSDPKSKRTVRKYMGKLAQYNLVDAEGEKRGRRYHAVE
jgi:orc1/cdc6 family replication initiation protein